MKNIGVPSIISTQFDTTSQTEIRIFIKLNSSEKSEECFVNGMLSLLLNVNVIM